MSHFKERSEKICLNCHTSLDGRFCHRCGQENVEPKETVWGLITHFFHDITHFDGKFFETTKWLIRKPGFLSKEYMLGRRARYLNPVRMYVFTSAFFFILFFAFFVDLKGVNVKTAESAGLQADLIRTEIRDTIIARIDSIKELDDLREPFRYVNKYNFPDSVFKRDTTAKKKKQFSGEEFFSSLGYESVESYDSIQKSYPAADRDGWLTRSIKRRGIHINQRMKEEGSSAVFKQWIDKFLHSFPQLLFVSLPLVAMILQLLYIRRTKKFYYVSHGIFLIHVYIYSFLNLLLFFTIAKVMNTFDWDWMGWLLGLLTLHALWYVYKAMRNFYGQGRFKTIMKFLILNFLTFIVITLLVS